MAQATAETPEPNPANVDEFVKTQYAEICKSHSSITDFRGKLLAMFPIAGAAGLLFVVGKVGSERAQASAAQGSATSGTNTDSLNLEVLTPVAVFALAITAGLFCYELRQIKECLTLRRQAAAIEARLNVPKDLGQFRDNPPLSGGVVGAELASWVVYVTLIAAWTYIALIAWIPPPWIGATLAIATPIVIGGKAVQIKWRDHRNIRNQEGNNKGGDMTLRREPK